MRKLLVHMSRWSIGSDDEKKYEQIRCKGKNDPFKSTDVKYGKLLKTIKRLKILGKHDQ